MAGTTTGLTQFVGTVGGGTKTLVQTKAAAWVAGIITYDGGIVTLGGMNDGTVIEF